MTTSLPPYKSQFLADCVSAGALKFGSFTLKSGRQSPYFFNAGLFYKGTLLRSITSAYAQTLSAAKDLEFDVIFGPAYKGIPLAATTLLDLTVIDEKRYGDCGYSFNRKEKKDHGEGGSIVGAPLKGKRIIIVDDVITAGTAIREAIDIIKQQGGELVGIIVAVDRQEKTPSPDGNDSAPRPSAIGEVRKQYGIPVLAILTLDDVVAYMKDLGTKEEIEALEGYRARYRASD